MPSGMPTAAAMPKACSVRLTVTRKSMSSGPPSRPLTSVCRVAIGGGSRIGLMKPARTVMSHSANSSKGPMAGRARDQRIVQPL